eukprot:gnl/TRDRNA2_/TRDRNA2_196547_c0_seq1.p2 gnl/TRDRNA2_/TRDRNA2_196547_c0~~gnl/TRDRNA2_/TRDRNA2_196547_c0_seq1.p2  ORF type:complete len:433 (-),score=96.82 gnl/TRDRNA2_/TRDRNA2_196547_c0_seq1:212-1510(-)
MGSPGPAEVVRWLHGLGGVLPRDAVVALSAEVQRCQMTGEEFGRLMASREMPMLGDEVRPTHMAALRRCWRADHGDTVGAGSRGGAASGEVPQAGRHCKQSRPAEVNRFDIAGGQRFAPPPRVPVAEAVQQSAPPTQLPPQPQSQQQQRVRVMSGDVDSNAQSQKLSDCMPPPAELQEPPDSNANGVAEAPRERPRVPLLNLSKIHGKHGASKSDQNVLPGRSWEQPAKQAAPAKGNGRLRKPQGFACASSEDQQYIAEFYGYRDEGFVATMHGLGTDEVRPGLFLGNMGDAAYWPLLQELGVNHIVNCAAAAQNKSPPYEMQGIKYLLLPLQDSKEQVEALVRQRFRLVREATRFVRQALMGKADQKGVILVHCVQGLSRSAALVCAYLMEYEGLTVDRAVSEVKTKHPGCLASSHWLEFLYKFNQDLLRL